MNIVFIGMSGSGKTTIGEKISIILSRKFYDTDNLIEENMDKGIDEIFDKYGEYKFREVETEIVRKVSKKNNVIISTGGGVVLNEDNMNNLKENGLIILLCGDSNTLLNNIKNSNIIRPLLDNDKELKRNIETMYKSRKELYMEYADYIIDINNKSIEEICREVLHLNKNVES